MTTSPLVRLADLIADISAGVSLQGENRQPGNGEVGILTLSALSGAKLDPAACKAIAAELASKVGPSVQANTILMSRSNTPELVGSCVFVESDLPDRFLPDLIWEIHLRPDAACDARWLVEYFRSTGRRNLLRAAAGTSGSMIKLSMNRLRNLRVGLPSEATQYAVVSVARAFHGHVEQLSQLLTAKRTFKRGLMQQLLTGQTRFPEFKERPWVKHRFDHLCEELSERNGSKLGADCVMGVIKGVGFEPMRERVRGKGDLSRYKVVPPGAFAYNPMRLNIGSIAYNDLRRTILVSPDYEVFRAREGIADSEYINQLRYSAYWLSFMDRAGAGSVRVRIYFTDLARLPVPAPAEDEQARIAQVLRLADLEIDQLAELHELIEAQRRALLAKLLSGSLPVPP
jgi:type I restriction enzyme S subunit